MVNYDSSCKFSMFNDPITAFPENSEIPYGPISVSREDVIKFATEFDPAPFHLDENAAKSSMHGDLIASGFHTCSLTMRMLCDAYLLQSTCEGAAEVETIDWLAPVRPGDTLSGKSIVLSNRQSRSKPEFAIIKFRNETCNQRGEPIMTLTNTVFFRKAGY